MIGVLIRPNLTAAGRFLSPFDPAGRGRLLLGGVLGAGVLAFVYFVSLKAIRFFSGVEIIGPLLTVRLLEFTFLAVLSFVLLSSLISALSTFYLSDDLLLVRAAPVAEGAFFVSRLVQTAAISSWMVLGFTLPVLLAYGSAMGGGLTYVGALALTFVPLLLIPTALGIAGITFLVCVFPARRVRDLFVVLGLVTAAMILLLLRVAEPERLMRPEAFGSVANYVSAFQVPASTFLPSTWATEALAGAVASRWDWRSIGVLWATAWGVGSIAFLLHRRFYSLAFSRAQEGGTGAYGRKLPFEAITDRLQGGLPSQSRAFAQKDSRLFLRDPGQWSQLLILLTLIIAYVYNYAVYPGAETRIAGLQVNHLLGIINLILAGFVLSALVARFTFPAVSIEGRAFWLVRTAPLPAGRFLRIKLVQHLIPLVSLGVGLAGVTAYWLKLPAWLIAVSCLHVGVVTGVMVSLGISFGALYPKLKFENAAQIPMSFGGVIFMLIATLTSLVSGLATAWLVAPAAMGRWERPLSWTLAGWAIWLTFHLAQAIIPLRLASRSLTKKEYV